MIGTKAAGIGWSRTAVVVALISGAGTAVFGLAGSPPASAATTSHTVGCSLSSTGAPSLAGGSAATTMCPERFYEAVPAYLGVIVRVTNPHNTRHHRDYSTANKAAGITRTWAISTGASPRLITCAVYPSGKPVLGDPGAGSGAKPGQCSFRFRGTNKGPIVIVAHNRRSTTYSLVRRLRGIQSLVAIRW